MMMDGMRERKVLKYLLTVGLDLVRHSDQAGRGHGGMISASVQGQTPDPPFPLGRIKFLSRSHRYTKSLRGSWRMSKWRHRVWTFETTYVRVQMDGVHAARFFLYLGRDMQVCSHNRNRRRKEG